MNHYSEQLINYLNDIFGDRFGVIIFTIGIILSVLIVMMPIVVSITIPNMIRKIQDNNRKYYLETLHNQDEIIKLLTELKNLNNTNAVVHVNFDKNNRDE